MQCIDWAVGNGAPLCLKKDYNLEFDAKADGANRFLKKKNVPEVPILGQKGPDGF